MILTRFPITNTEKRLIWAPDQYFVGTRVLGATLRLDDGSSVQVFADICLHQTRERPYAAPG